MGIRASTCYRWDSPAYTRVANNPQDSFITGIPGSKLTRFNMGNPKGEFDTELSIMVEKDIQVRHNSLESSRIAINRILEDKIGTNNYHFKIRVYPHHIIREHVMATGAGADRVQSGMRHSFGKPMGRVARVHKDQPLATVYFNESEEKTIIAKKALRSGMMKLPGRTMLVMKKIKKK